MPRRRALLGPGSIGNLVLLVAALGGCGQTEPSSTHAIDQAGEQESPASCNKWLLVGDSGEVAYDSGERALVCLDDLPDVRRVELPPAVNGSRVAWSPDGKAAVLEEGDDDETVLVVRESSDWSRAVRLEADDDSSYAWLGAQWAWMNDEYVFAFPFPQNSGVSLLFSRDGQLVETYAGGTIEPGRSSFVYYTDTSLSWITPGKSSLDLDLRAQQVRFTEDDRLLVVLREGESQASRNEFPDEVWTLQVRRWSSCTPDEYADSECFPRVERVERLGDTERFLLQLHASGWVGEGERGGRYRTVVAKFGEPLVLGVEDGEGEFQALLPPEDLDEDRWFDAELRGTDYFRAWPPRHPTAIYRYDLSGTEGLVPAPELVVAAESGYEIASAGGDTGLWSAMAPQMMVQSETLPWTYINVAQPDDGWQEYPAKGHPVTAREPRARVFLDGSIGLDTPPATFTALTDFTDADAPRLTGATNTVPFLAPDSSGVFYQLDGRLLYERFDAPGEAFVVATGSSFWFELPHVWE